MRTTLLFTLAMGTLAGCDASFLSPWSSADAGGWGDDWGQMEPYLRGDHQGFDQQSSLYTETKGVALTYSGERGVAGMNYATCQFRSATGAIDVDIDAATDEETVEDALEDGDTMVTITSSVDGVQISDIGSWSGTTTDTYNIPGVSGAAFDGNDVVVAATEGAFCSVKWLEGGTVAAGRGACGDLSVADGVVYVGVGGDIVSIEDGEANPIGFEADLFEHDAQTGLIYAADFQDAWVKGVSANGTTLWTVWFDDGLVNSLRVMGDRGELMVGLQTAEGGRLAVLDGATGNEVGSAQTTGNPQDISISGDGHVAVVRSGWNTHVLTVQ